MKDGIRNIKDLEMRIAELEAARRTQLEAMRKEVDEWVHELSPSYLLKSALGQIGQSSEWMELAIANMASVAAGMITRKWLVRKSGRVGAKVAGLFIQLAITWAVAANAPGLKEKLQELMEKVKAAGAKKKKSGKKKKKTLPPADGEMQKGDKKEALPE